MLTRMERHLEEKKLREENSLKELEEKLKDIDDINEKLNFIYDSTLPELYKKSLIWEEIYKDRVNNPSDETLKEVKRIINALKEKGYYRLKEPWSYQYINNNPSELVHFMYKNEKYSYQLVHFKHKKIKRSRQEECAYEYYQSTPFREVSLKEIEEIIKIRSVDGWR